MATTSVADCRALLISNINAVIDSIISLMKSPEWANQTVDGKKNWREMLACLMDARDRA